MSSDATIDATATIADISRRFAAVHDFDSMLRALQATFEDVLRAEYWGLYLADPQDQRLRLVLSGGFTDDERIEVERTANERHPGQVFRSREVLHVADTRDEASPRTVSAQHYVEVRARLWVPVISREECYGAVGLASLTPHRFDAIDIAVMRIVADLTAIVYRNILTQRALVRAKERAEAASRAKGQFLANMSHEVRTPLNGVMGMAALLEDTPLTREQREYATVIRSSASALLEIVNDILDVSKVEAGMMEIEPVPFDLRSVCDDVISLCGRASSGRGVALHLDYDQGCPTGFVGDVGRVRQILLNLLTNAVKFTPEGWVRLVVRERERQERLSIVDLAVVDTGVGIPSDKLEYVFEKFAQADASTTRRYGGTGLGLAISRGLAQAMGGSLTVTSEQGAGSTFTLRLPLPRVERVNNVTPVAPERTWAPLSRGVRALVVEDNPTNQRVAVQILKKFGVTSEVANHGAEAVEAVRARPFDVVFMDCHMPVMDGLAATRAIRDLGTERARVPIVAMTASAMEEDRAACIAVGMDAYISKPLSLEALHTTLRTIGLT